MDHDTSTEDSVKALAVMGPSRRERQPEPAVDAAPIRATRAAGDGYLYVIEFSSGRIKAGFTTNLKTRLANHATMAKAFGASIAQTWKSPQHFEAKPNEKVLLSLLLAEDGASSEGEYFSGVSWARAVHLAETNLTMTPVSPGESTREQKRARATAERTRILDAFEDRIELVRRRVHGQLRSAGVEPNKVGAQRWLMDPDVTRVLARLHDGEDIAPQEIREAFGVASE